MGAASAKQLFFLSHAVLAPWLATACSCDTNCTRVDDNSHGVWCLRECGFAVLRGVYDKAALDELNAAVENNRDELQKAWSVAGPVRGEHLWLGFPNRHPFNRSEWLYNPRLSQFVEEYSGGKVTLDLVSFFLNPASGSTYQAWHMDSMQLPFALKVQIPLIDISSMHGPTEFSVLKYDVMSAARVAKRYMREVWDGRRTALEEDEPFREYLKQEGLLLECTVKGTYERGSVMAYINSLPHRGTPNRSPHNRVIMDHAYGTTNKRANEATKFPSRFQRNMELYSRLYEQYRDEDHNAAEATAKVLHDNEL